MAGSAGLLGVLNFSNASTTTTLTAPTAPSGASSFGFGGFLRGSGPATVEVDVLYMPRKLSNGTATDFTMNVLEVPLFFRFTGIPFVSLGAGGYYALRLGTPTGAGTTTNFGSHDFGLMAAAGFEIPIGPVGLLAEARYLFGLADMGAPTSGSLRWRNLEFAFGVKFSFL